MSTTPYNPLAIRCEEGCTFESTRATPRGWKGESALLVIDQDGLLAAPLRAEFKVNEDETCDLALTTMANFNIATAQPKDPEYRKTNAPMVLVGSIAINNVALGLSKRLYAVGNGPEEAEIEAEYHVPLGFVTRAKLRPVTDFETGSKFYSFHLAYVFDDAMGTALPVIVDTKTITEVPLEASIDVFNLLPENKRAIRVGSGQIHTCEGHGTNELQFLTCKDMLKHNAERLTGPGGEAMSSRDGIGGLLAALLGGAGGGRRGGVSLADILGGKD